MQNSVSLALFLDNGTILEDAYSRIMALMTVSVLYDPKLVTS